MNSGIYKIVNTLNGKVYVGSAKDFQKRWKRHFNDLEKQQHSSIKLQRSYNKHGKDVFVCEIIEEIPYEKDKILEREQYWIDTLNSKENGYNIADASFGDYLTNHPLREEIITKIKKTIHDKISAMSVEERKEKWSRSGDKNGMYGRHRTEEEKRHLSEINKGKPGVFKGKHHSEEAKRKMSESKQGKCTGENNPFYGKQHSKKTKEKLSKIRQGKKPTNMRKVVVDGTVFESVAECARHFNVCNATVIFRIKSKHWNWFYYEDDEKLTAPMAV